MVNRFLDTAFFYDAGKVAARTAGPRSRRAEGRLRVRHPLPRPVLDATPRRDRQEPRRPRLVFRRRHLLRMLHAHITTHVVTGPPRRPPAARRRRARFCRQRAPRPRRRTFTPTIRSRVSRNRRTRRRRRQRHRLDVRDGLQPVRHAGYKPTRHRGRRTSTRSTRCRTRAGSRTASARDDDGRRDHARRERRRAARSVEVGADPGEDRRRRIRASPRRTPTATRGSSSSIRRTFPEARPARSRSRRRSSGRWATTRSNRS